MYGTKAIPYFVAMVVIEFVTLKLMGKNGTRFNDAVISTATGLMMSLKE